ncbi:hypothetical protein [Legionella brunensis]|nr:hypothetical protein [Legionella brunensis]
MQGLTLLELICTLILLALLFLLSVPSGLSLFNKNQLQVAEDEISTAICYARKMALLLDARLALTPIDDSGDWSKGMLLFVDNKKHKYHQGDKLLHQWKWHFRGLQISWKGFQSNSYLLFANNLNHAATSGHFDLLTVESNHAKLVVNRFGRVVSQP